MLMNLLQKAHVLQFAYLYITVIGFFFQLILIYLIGINEREVTHGFTMIYVNKLHIK